MRRYFETLPARIWKKKWIFLLLISFVCLFFLVDIFQDARQKSIEKDNLSLLYPQISKSCFQSIPESYGTIPERLRHCVHINTVERVDEEFFRDWKNKVAMAQGVLDYMEGRRTEKKPFECSTRSGLLIDLLHFNGFKARDVITAKFLPDFDDHVLVEVWDEETAGWELLGPSYDMIFKDKQGTKLSMLEVVTLGKDNFEPCFQDGRCGWDLETDEGVKLSDAKDYWGNMVMRDENDEWRVIYNPAHFDPQKPLEGQSYCQKREKFCRISPVATDELKL